MGGFAFYCFGDTFTLSTDDSINFIYCFSVAPLVCGINFFCFLFASMVLVMGGSLLGGA